MKKSNFFKVKYLVPVFIVLIFVYFGVQNYKAKKDLEKME